MVDFYRETTHFGVPIESPSLNRWFGVACVGSWS